MPKTPPESGAVGSVKDDVPEELARLDVPELSVAPESLEDGGGWKGTALRRSSEIRCSKVRELGLLDLLAAFRGHRQVHVDAHTHQSQDHHGQGQRQDHLQERIAATT